MLVVVLAAGRPFRGAVPSLLQTAPDKRRTLDWQLEAFCGLQASFRFVVGYRSDALTSCLPKDAEVIIEPMWHARGAAGSLMRGLVADDPCFVVYSDVLFRRQLVMALHGASRDADVVLAVDSNWRRRFPSRAAVDIETAEKVQLQGSQVRAIGVELTPDSSHAEFIGLAYLSSDVVARLRRLELTRPDCVEWAVPALFAHLLRDGIRAAAVDAAGDWATLDEPQDSACLVLGSKAQTLERLANAVTQSTVPRLVAIAHRHWSRNSQAILADLARAFDGQALAVRSSALREDGWASSMAGAYTTVLNVPSAVPDALREAIDTVFKGYGMQDDSDEVLVQRMIVRARASGVAMTRTLTHGAPYLIVNYDDESGRTDRVTSGVDFSGKALYCHHSALGEVGAVAPVLGRLPAAIREVVGLVGFDSLDLEFAVDRAGAVSLLQVRPITAHSGDWSGEDGEIEAVISSGEAEFRRLQTPQSGVVGRRTVFSVMTDWNPAEMIGLRPRRLAFDLYRYLITDSAWAQQRSEFGYRELRPTPLMVSLAGYAYIDVRASLNSFIPASLADGVAQCIIEAQIDRLVRASHFHDKVEFEIATTCLDLGFPRRRQEMRVAGVPLLDIDAWERALREITGAAIDPDRFDELDHALARLEGCRVGLRGGEPLPTALKLLDECRGLGTPAFAHFARHAFIAMALLRSAIREGVLPPDAEERVFGETTTVAGALADDCNAVAAGRLGLSDFLDRHGHLRPGTYDITEPSYREAPERYLSGLRVMPARERPRGWTAAERGRFARALSSIGLPGDINRVEAWMRRAVEGREHAKHIFTRCLSEALDLISRYGESTNLSRQELSHLGLDDLRAASADIAGAGLRAWLAARSEAGASAYRNALRVELPPLLCSLRDFRIFHQVEASANFVGTGTIVAATVDLERAAPPYDLHGRIVLVRQADPGYDWIFSHAPAGLVTAFGGANSHMTIRSAELRLPAAIGVGERVFDKLCSGNVVLRLDCAGRRLEIVR